MSPRLSPPQSIPPALCSASLALTGIIFPSPFTRPTAPSLPPLHLASHWSNHGAALLLQRPLPLAPPPTLSVPAPRDPIGHPPHTPQRPPRAPLPARETLIILQSHVALFRPSSYLSILPYIDYAPSVTRLTSHPRSLPPLTPLSSSSRLSLPTRPGMSFSRTFTPPSVLP